MLKDAKLIDSELKKEGYKFLGWLNSGEPQLTVDYLCCVEDLKHKRNNIQHNTRGSENTVSCDICKIYWKYDCSD